MFVQIKYTVFATLNQNHVTYRVANEKHVHFCSFGFCHRIIVIVSLSPHFLVRYIHFFIAPDLEPCVSGKAPVLDAMLDKVVRMF